MMFKGLDAIEWDTLTHGHGSAAMFPYWIRALTAQQSSIRQQAIHELQYITDQGIIYPPLTRLTLPFLIELLANPYVKGRDAIIVLLTEVIDAAYDCIESGPYAEEAQSIYALAEAHFSLYLRFVEPIANHVVGEEAIRFEALWLLACFPQHIESIRSVFERAFICETSERVQMRMLFIYEELTKNEE